MNTNTMTYNPQQYETVYGFSILDELHNFMPELLYDEGLFPNEMLSYFRHRMSTLFHPIFVRQQNVYNIYMAQSRRIAFDEWRRNRTPRVVATPVPPAGVPDILGALNNVLNTNTTPQAQIRRRNTVELPTGTGNLIGVNTVGQSLRAASTTQAPGAEPATAVNTPPPPRRHRNPNNNFITANELLNFTTTTTAARDADSLFGLLAGAMLGGIDVPITTTGGARGFWHEVDVVATPAQIAAGSTVVEGSTIGADVNCAICQEHTYADGQSTHQWRKLHCSHQFHLECVDSWLEQSVHCPVCRADIRETGGDSVSAGGAGSGSYAAAARRGVSRSPSTG